MMNFLRKHMRKIFIVTIIAFIGGIFVGGGAYLFGPGKNIGSIATVNGTKIPAKLFDSVYRTSVNMYRNATKEAPAPELLEELKVKTIQALIQDEIFYQQSLNYKIIVSDVELKNDIQSSMLFGNKQNGFDAGVYYAFLNSVQMTPKEYEEMRRKQIAGEKVKLLLASAVKISDSEYEAAVAAGNKMTKEEMLQFKGNAILNEWFMSILNHSKIVTNEAAFKQV